MLWLPFGLAAGLSSAMLTRKLLPSVLEGRSPIGAVLIGARLLFHIVILAVAAGFSREALLWVAAGDVVGLIGFAIVTFLKGRK